MEDPLRNDDETRARLIAAAGEVFVRQGFRSATVREICSRADVHLGSVNYHFRSKQGLYSAVLEHSYQSAIKKYPPDMGLEQDATPEEKLQAFIRSFLLRMLDDGVSSWHGKLIAREIADPTGALGELAQNSIKPLYIYLTGILRELLGERNVAEIEDGRGVFLCAMSIVGQCLHHFTGKRVIAALCPKSFDPADIDAIAEHIMRFSLGGIREFQK